MMRVYSPGPEEGAGGAGACVVCGIWNDIVAPPAGPEGAAGGGADEEEPIALNCCVSEPALGLSNADGAGLAAGGACSGVLGPSSVRSNCVRPPPPPLGGTGAAGGGVGVEYVGELPYEGAELNGEPLVL
jgi:hypothetical protein